MSQADRPDEIALPASSAPFDPLEAPAGAPVPQPEASLGSRVAHGAKWSMFGNLITRAGSFITGAIVANLVAPKELGVFAVALMVGLMVLTFIDMGLGADLTRSSDEEVKRKSPTIASIGLVFCTLGALLLLLLADVIADLLRSPESAALIRVYAAVVFIGGFAIVPQAILTRRLDQKAMFIATVSNFVLSNGITIGLLLATDIGVLSLPIGAVIGMAVEVALFYVLAGVRPHYGWDAELVRPVLSFGFPVAGSNMLQVVLSNADRMVVSRLLGPHRLGFYTLAANVANWPVSVFGLVVRQISLPAFAHTSPRDREPVLTLGSRLTWLIALPVGVMLALFARDVVLFVYNPNYLASIPLLATLGIYGAIRVMFDTFTGFLYARGDSQSVLVANITWTIALFVVTAVCARLWGTEGAAVAQIATVVLVALPIFFWGIHRAKGSVVDILLALVPASLAVIPAAVVGLLLNRWVDSLHLVERHTPLSNPLQIRLDAMIGLAVGGFSFLAVYVPIVFRRVKADLAGMRAPVESA